MSDRELLKLQEEIEALKARLVEVESRSTPRLRKQLARLMVSPRVRIALAAAVVAIPLAAYAAQISVPNTFVNGTAADATEVNANFSTLVTESNAQDLRLAALEGQVATNTSDIGTIQSDVATNTSDIGTNASDIGTLQSDVSTNTSDIATNQTDIAANTGNIATNTGDISTLQTDVGDNTTDIATNTAAIGTLNTTFTGVSRGGTPDTLTFSGMNVQVVDGSGDTDGAVNGLGNLIIGYNEDNYSAARTGSHNLVVGINHEYTSYAGFVAGQHNTIGGHSSSISGGYLNTASASLSSVGGGQHNTAAGAFTSVSGGQYNTAALAHSNSVVVGGNGNSTTVANEIVPSLANQLPCVSQVGDEVYFTGCNVNVRSGAGSTDGTLNGLGNLIVGYDEDNYSATRTGSHNLVVGMDHEYTSYAGLVAGGWNTITAPGASVSGGYQNRAGNVCSGGTNPGAQCLDDGDCTGGGTCGTNAYQSVSGGNGNRASGGSASVSGGRFNSASAFSTSVSGGFQNKAAGQAASVSGGYSNVANGDDASVSGGSSNVASASYASVSGGYSNVASASYASVSGGYSNTASNGFASISGGRNNEAGGDYSSVSGGYQNWAGNVCSGGTNPGAQCLDDGDCTGGGTCGTNWGQSVSGGYGNEASGLRASVSGGASNTAGGSQDSVVGDAGKVYVDATAVH